MAHEWPTAPFERDRGNGAVYAQVERARPEGHAVHREEEHVEKVARPLSMSGFDLNTSLGHGIFPQGIYYVVSVLCEPSRKSNTRLSEGSSNAAGLMLGPVAGPSLGWHGSWLGLSSITVLLDPVAFPGRLLSPGHGAPVL